MAGIVRQGLLESSLMTTFGRVSYCCLLDKSRRAAHVLVEIKRFVYCTCICKSVFVLVEIKRWSSQTVDRMWFHAACLWIVEVLCDQLRCHNCHISCDVMTTNVCLRVIADTNTTSDAILAMERQLT